MEKLGQLMQNADLPNTLVWAKATARNRLQLSGAGLLRRRPSWSSLDGIGCTSVCHVEINHIISVYTHYGLYFGICWVKFFQQLDPTYPKTWNAIHFQNCSDCMWGWHAYRYFFNSHAIPSHMLQCQPHMLYFYIKQGRQPALLMMSKGTIFLLNLGPWTEARRWSNLISIFNRMIEHIVDTFLLNVRTCDFHLFSF